MHTWASPWRSLAWVLLMLVLGVPAAHTEPRAPPGPPRGARQAETPPDVLPPPARLPPAARELLNRRMQRHGADMTRLITLVVLLRYDEVLPLSERIATEPQIARPLPGDMDELNVQLPARFFTYQEELSERARVLTEAARTRSSAGLSATFGRLTETCVACHAAYRSDPAPR